MQKEEILSDFPSEVQKQNQYVLNLIYQFGNNMADQEEQLEYVTFKLLGEDVCEDCLCILFNLSDGRYERIKNFYRVGLIFLTTIATSYFAPTTKYTVVSCVKSFR